MAPVTLNQLKPGQTGVVTSAPATGDYAAVLAAMGLCCNAKVVLCRAGEPCNVSVVSGSSGGCRIGLARPLADRILVEPLNQGS